MKLAVVCLLLALILVVAFGRLAAGAPQIIPAVAPTATYDPFGTNGCKTCDPQQRRVQATSISE
jgi:hypothetical protein